MKYDRQIARRLLFRMVESTDEKEPIKVRPWDRNVKMGDRVLLRAPRYIPCIYMGRTVRDGFVYVAEGEPGVSKTKMFRVSRTRVFVRVGE